MDELLWVLSKVKKRAAAGKDGITLTMMNFVVPRELWLKLFNVSQEAGQWDKKSR